MKIEHQSARSNIDDAYSGCQQMRSKITEAKRFARVPGAQWEGSTFAGYDLGKLEKYPRFELNKIAKECNKIISEYRKNRISVRFRPTDSEASEDLAEKLNGAFRADWNMSDGAEAADNAFDDAVSGGFGCIRIDADLEDDQDPLNDRMKLRFKPVMDAERCVFFDPNSKDFDKSDAMWAAEIYSMDPKSFEREYPEASPSSMEVDAEGMIFDWTTPDAVYIARYYEVRIEPCKLQAYRNTLTQQIEVYDLNDIEDIQDELDEGGFEPVGEPRETKRRRVYCGVMSGAEWLEEPYLIPGTYIPLIPVYGKRWFVDNQERIEGHVQKAMDAQRLENLMVSMIADNATQAGGDNIPIVDIDMVPGALANFWAARNTERPAFLPMKSLKDKNGNIVTPASVLGYTPATPMSPALAALLQWSGTAIGQITGSDQLASIPSNIATDTVDSIFNRLDTQSYIYMDNMAKSMRHLGRVWLSMKREVTGSEQQVMVMEEDGSDSMTTLTTSIADTESGVEIPLNDLSQGRYDVTVDVGQSFTARRDSTVRQMTELLRVVPPQSPLYGPVLSMIISNMDGEGIDDLKEFNRNQMLLAGYAEPKTDEEKAMVQQARQAQAQQPNPQMLIAQAEMGKAQAEQINAQNRVAETQIKAFKAQSDAQKAQSETVLNYVKADDINKKDIMEAIRLIKDLTQDQINDAIRSGGMY